MTVDCFESLQIGLNICNLALMLTDLSAKSRPVHSRLNSENLPEIVDRNHLVSCERLVNRLSEKVVKSRILPKINVRFENKNKYKM